MNAANVREARRHIDEALELTAGAFQRTLKTRDRILLEKARLLSSDFAFKEAAATGDHGTLLSALENHQARVAANVMMLVSMEGAVEADTLHPREEGVAFALPHLLAAAMESEFGEASSIEFLDERPYQLVVVPLFAPEPSAWIVIGFLIDETFARALQEDTKSQVSLLRRGAGERWQIFASTLAPGAREWLATHLSPDLPEAARSISIDVQGREFLSCVAPVKTVGPTSVVALLQRSLDEALRPYMRLRRILLLVLALGLALSLGGGVLLASRVTRPVAVLAAGARRIAEGDYAHPVRVAQEDELGVLASSFNHMMKGLAERDRVRSLLGKVVSPAIAEELLSKEIELGGEERTVSVLFSDIRNFTSIAERESPQGLVRLLNIYLTRVSATVERHGGVVDKYVGDAVMALFGAPLRHDDDARRSVLCALEMCRSLDEINAELGAAAGSGRRDAPLAIGVGIHTGVVVAGNMGSTTRLNYTVIGDGVNLASRLESLTKRYGVGIIVSESTRRACPDVLFRELDRVRVKGRVEPVSIFEPLGLVGEVGHEVAAEAEAFHAALARYRARDWEGAGALFADLAGRVANGAVARLYLARLEALGKAPPGPEWDGTVTYEEK